MQNVGQIGFDFGDVTPAYRLAADYTWKERPRTLQEHSVRLVKAQDALSSIVGLPHAVFSDTLQSVVQKHIKQVEWCGYDTHRADAVYELWGHEVSFTPAEYETLIAHCIANDGRTVDGVEYKVRARPSWWSTEIDVSVGMYVANVGSIVMSRNYSRNGTWYNLSFRLIERHAHFMETYMDDAEYAYCSEAVWGPAYSAQIISENASKIPSVRTFKFQGREYTNTGGSHCGNHSQCSAWSIVSTADWNGETYSYDQLVKAWDRGAAQRGDMRGLLVRVRGQLCVLEKPMRVYDDQPREIVFASADDEEESNGDDFDQGDADEEEEEQEALYA